MQDVPYRMDISIFLMSATRGWAAKHSGRLTSVCVCSAFLGFSVNQPLGADVPSDREDAPKTP
jgi:hypothetical protein